MQPQRLARKPLGEVTVDLCARVPGALVRRLRKRAADAGRDARAVRRDPHLAARGAPRAAVAAALPALHAAARAHARPPAHDALHLLPLRDGHGRFTPFVQFLREKDFIRPLSPAELARLKATIRIVQCSSCGAPVDLEKDAACPYCRAPIAILDPDAVDATVRALESAETRADDDRRRRAGRRHAGRASARREFERASARRGAGGSGGRRSRSRSASSRSRACLAR